jgi:hypothetical protein
MVTMLASVTVGETQPSIPDGVFLRDARGEIWFVRDGRRVQVPIFPATDDEVAALPLDRADLSFEHGTIALGSRPAWLGSDGQEPGPDGGPIGGLDGLATVVLQASRGWLPQNTSPRPRTGMELLTVEVRVENSGDRSQRYNGWDFRVDVEDGSRWKRTVGRSPALIMGTLRPGSSAQGWLTFEVPVGQPAVQLVWFMRPDYAVAIPLGLPSTSD